MRMPDNADRARSAPLRAVRAIFASVGQLLLAADKFRSEYEDLGAEDQYDPLRTWDNPVTEAGEAGPQARPEAGPEAEPEKAGKDGDEETMRIRKNRSREAEPPRKFRSLDLTGNVRVLTPAELAELASEDAAGDETAADDNAEDDIALTVTPGPVTPGLVTPSYATPEVSVWDAKTSIWDTAEPSPWTAPAPALPVDGYDGLSIASLRARLRSLNVAQLQILLDHERSGAGREEFVTMLERRIVKLTATADDAS